MEFNFCEKYKLGSSKRFTIFLILLSVLIFNHILYKDTSNINNSDNIISHRFTRPLIKPMDVEIDKPSPGEETPSNRPLNVVQTMIDSFSQTIQDFQIRHLVKTKRCQKSGLIMVNDGGQLANQLSAYASLLAASKFVNATPVISYNIRSKLIMEFPFITIPVLYPDPCPKSINWTYVEIEDIQNLTTPINQNIFINGWPVEIPLQQIYRHLILKEFKMNLQLVAKADHFLNEISVKYKANVFIGVHVRRTDYEPHLKNLFKGRLLSKRYFMEAKLYLEEKFPHSKMIFIVASDDPKWCQKMFADEENMVMTDPSNSAGLDLAILSHCNHSIISIGTFSFWSAYLKPEMGEVVVADGYSSITPRLLGKIKLGLPEWKIIKDPCFTIPNFNSSSILESINGNLTVERLKTTEFLSVPEPEVSPECIGKEIEYGIS